MIIQNPDGSLVQETGSAQRLNVLKKTYYAEVPSHLLDERSSMIEQIITFAFDILNARHVEVRVCNPE